MHHQLTDQKGKQSFFAEVVNTEKQLWALIHSKGLLHSETQDLYQKVRSSYVKVILNEQETEQPQDIEYSLWKLHYKHIDEFRKRIRQSSANGESKKSTMPQNVANTQNSNDKYLEGFKLFLLEATEFYQDLIKKIRRCNGLPEEPLFYRKSGIYGSVLPTKMHDCQFSCHRFFVCLGDLARYRERYEKPDVQSRNWSVAATYYLEATMIGQIVETPKIRNKLFYFGDYLAVLATYVGDEFLALYHCVRSLAVKEPFPDAWKNLIVLFEEVIQSAVPFKGAHFDFLKPSESFEMIQSQSSDGSSNCSISSSTEEVHSVETDLCLEDFPSTFASTMKELKRLMTLDNTKLKATLESYQRTDAGRTGPFRAIQVVSVLIFIIENLTKNPEQKDPKAKNNMQQPALTQLALAATFICMGCFTDRCLTGNPVNDCPHFTGCACICGVAGGRVMSSLQILLLCGKTMSCVALHQLFIAHESLDFGAHWGNLNSYESRNECRGQRITHAAIKIANGSSDSRKWIIYDEVERKFYTAESKKSPNSRGSELVEPCSAVEVELPCQPICEINKECEQQILGENQSSPQVHSKSVAVEEKKLFSSTYNQI
ncbi:Protein SMG7L [Vitis vinifera]|uniref:Protein SMG7L n=1 Tax=Vitis vinifera TaxID=29760 RepID=A0A438IGK0_VITVI|nr:Protein SMG7L [Vitis vinifera]